jgi:hypothetical protein
VFTVPFSVRYSKDVIFQIPVSNYLNNARRVEAVNSTLGHCWYPKKKIAAYLGTYLVKYSHYHEFELRQFNIIFSIMTKTAKLKTNAKCEYVWFYSCSLIKRDKINHV